MESLIATNLKISLPQTQLTQRRKAVMCGLALCLLLTLAPILNLHVFDVLDDVAPYARDVCTLAGSFFALAVALVARTRPKWVSPNMLFALMIAFFVVGCAGTSLGIANDFAPVVYVCASLSSIARAFAFMLVAVALSRMEQRLWRRALMHGFLTSCVLGALVYLLPPFVNIVLSYLLVAVAACLTVPMAKTVFDHQAQSDAPQDVEVTRPNTFLPLSAKLFWCLLLFALALGYSLRLGDTDGTPSSYAIAFAVILFLYVGMLVLKKPFPADILVRISAIVIIAGFLSVLLFETDVSRIPNAIIGSGYIVFEMVSWIVLVSVACKNPLDAIPVIAWGRGIISLGVTIGAQVGNLTNWLSQATSLGVSVVTCVFVLLFCAYDMFVLHFFSFDETIHDLVPLKEVALSPKVLEAQVQDNVSLIDRRCQAIGGSCGLTPKETEVFTMLAKGRNSAFIQEKLVVSKNTVKTHVKHIYQKLDIHSHQELIDFVESYTDK